MVTSFNKKHGGFALIVVLIITALISVGVVMFLTQSLADRKEAYALANGRRAMEAVDSATKLGMAQVQSLFALYPDSATAWADGATRFCHRAGADGAITAIPLVSGAQADGSLAVVNDQLPFEHGDNSVDLNEARYAGDLQGRIGSPDPTVRQELRVPWVELPEEEGRVIRLAWWIEDESFRLDLNQVGTTPRGESPGASPAEIPFQGLLTSLLPAEEVEKVATALPAFRSSYPGDGLPEIMALNQLHPDHPELGDRLRYATTIHSGSLNVSRRGAPRLNINRVVSPSNEPVVVRRQLDLLLAPIRNALPQFGQRFYRSTEPIPAAHAEIYLQKVAANLRDALTPDSQPTLVLADGSVQIGEPTDAILPNLSAPAGAMNNPVIAIGKENVPYLQEYACRVTLRRFERRNDTFWAYRFSIDHYFEFWNMGTREIRVDRGDLGQAPFLQVGNLPGFDTGDKGTKIGAGRSIKIPLPNDLVFPPGQVTVLTTDGALTYNKMLMSTTPPIHLPGGTETFEGFTNLQTVDGKFRVNLATRHTTTTDYGTTLLLGNERGHLESFAALPLVRGDSEGNNALSIHNDEGTDRVWSRIVGARREAYYVRGGSLRGNHLTPLITGDPRTNNEQLILRPYDASGDQEQTRFYHSELGNPGSTGQLNVPGKSTLGAHNTNFVDPALWPDPTPHGANGITSPMVVPNGPFASIGELGHLFDPARELGPTRNIAYSRGGGRTLAIGQPDRTVNDRPGLEAWRLTDLFTTTDDLQLSGRLNLNGIRRDGGAAFRALLHGLRLITGPEGDPTVGGLTPDADLADHLIERLEARGPLMERGEFSECFDFPPIATLPLDQLHDRGREELFRRLVELICTKGNRFTIHALGQVCQLLPDGSRSVLGAARMQMTFELVPEWTPPLPPLPDPANPAAYFRPPDRFNLRVLAVTP